MKRILKKSDRVYELYLNVRKNTVRVKLFGRTYVAESPIVKFDRVDILTYLHGSYDDIEPLLNSLFSVMRELLFCRNPYFSHKTGKPLSKWFEI